MTVENWKRGTFEPLTGIVGGGPFDRPAGNWTDDTAMAICLAESILEIGGFDARDQMNRYSQWAQRDYLSSTETNYDIGGTIAEALLDFRNTGEPFSGSTSPESAGNGSIMRLAPVPMYFDSDLHLVEQHAADSSRTTHGATECVDACRLLGRIIWRAFRGLSKDEVALGDNHSFAATPKILSIAKGEYRDKPEAAVHGTGYVVDSLEAAMWCFTRTETLEEAILAAANLGDDADTTAAVCGQVAGAHYGMSGIPSSWLDVLAMRAEIEILADRLFQARRR